MSIRINAISESSPRHLTRVVTAILIAMLIFVGWGVTGCKANAGKDGVKNGQHRNVPDKGDKGQTSTESLPGLLDSSHFEKPVTKKAAGRQDVQIIIPAWYRTASGLPVIDPKDKWQELYFDSTDNNWKSGDALLKTSRQYEECSGDSALVVGSGHDALFLFTGVNNVLPVVSTVATNELLFPGHDLLFVVNGIQYKLTANSNCFDDQGHIVPLATLQKAQQESLMNNCKQLDYRLSLVQEDETPMEIFRIDSLEFTNPTLIWLGDLNNDGLPDLLLDIPQFTESSMYYLYLSDPQDQAMPIKFAAKIFIQRDC